MSHTTSSGHYCPTTHSGWWLRLELQFLAFVLFFHYYLRHAFIFQVCVTMSTSMLKLLRNNETRMPYGMYEGSLICKMVWISEQRVYLQRLCNQAISDVSLRENIVLCLRLRQECIAQPRNRRRRGICRICSTYHSRSRIVSHKFCGS